MGSFKMRFSRRLRDLVPHRKLGAGTWMDKLDAVGWTYVRTLTARYKERAEHKARKRAKQSRHINRSRR